MRALAIPIAGTMVFLSVVVYYGGNAALRRCELRVGPSNRLCVDTSATSTFEPPPARPSEASGSSGSPSCIDTKGQSTRDIQKCGAELL